MATPYLDTLYTTSIISELQKQFGYMSVMQVPRLQKIVISSGVGDVIQNRKRIEHVINEITLIAGQKAVPTKAKLSISNFKLREGMSIGVKVTLRKKRMYEFLYRLINIAIPRVKDFRGIKKHGFDGHGSYSLGIQEHIIFPEIDYDKIEKIIGLNITFVTSAKTDEEAKALLEKFNMPFYEIRGYHMAKKSLIYKALRTPKYRTRKVNRCNVCGRVRGYMRRFQLCRICFRNFASSGLIPGVKKSSW